MYLESNTPSAVIKNQLAILSPRMQILFLNLLHNLPLDNTDMKLFADYLNSCKK